MPIPLRPELRAIDLMPVGPKEEHLYLCRDPEGFGEPMVLPYGAVVLASMMDGQHTLAEIQTTFQARTEVPVALADLEQIVRQLDDAYLLAGERFEEHRNRQVESYQASPTRPATHAGAAYALEPDALREQIAGFFAAENGPGPVNVAASPGGRLGGLISPHIDLRRGGHAFAWAYKQVAEQSDADLFVIFGTSHTPMTERFSVTRKDFDTPLGTVSTDQAFIDRLSSHLASSVAGRSLDLSANELAHRFEHSIEFQTVLLQYLLGGKRDFRIVPVLTSSFEDFIAEGTQPEESLDVQAFLAALQAAAGGHQGKVCCIAAADLGHIGPRFGDPWLVDAQRLADQSADDHKLLEFACSCDPTGLFCHVALQRDCRRICGLAPTYMLLSLMRDVKGELLCYDQAIEPDGSACVSFASVAFWQG